jgi:hypothetical protein
LGVVSEEFQGIEHVGEAYYLSPFRDVDQSFLNAFEYVKMSLLQIGFEIFFVFCQVNQLLLVFDFNLNGSFQVITNAFLGILLVLLYQTDTHFTILTLLEVHYFLAREDSRGFDLLQYLFSQSLLEGEAAQNGFVVTMGQLSLKSLLYLFDHQSPPQPIE